MITCIETTATCLLRPENCGLNVTEQLCTVEYANSGVVYSPMPKWSVISVNRRFICGSFIGLLGMKSYREF